MVAPLSAQDLAGRIDGLVLDQQQSVIPGAEVSATHRDTNFTYRTVTTDSGRFTFPKARLGFYDLIATMPGFDRARVEDVLVEVAGVANLKILLRVGTSSQTITVTAEKIQAIVNTVSPEISSVVDNRRVRELPLNGRNASHLLLLQAGVHFERDSQGRGSRLFVHGQRHNSLNITLDGVDTQDNFNRSSLIMLDQPMLALSAENVQEFRVITGLSSAEFSRGGAQMTAVTRSGSNEVHGSLFWFHRNTVFNANEFFNNSVAPKIERPPLLRHQFGGSVGGPIFKDRTFFFFGYQQTNESRAIPVNRLVYTSEARQGLFRYLDGLRTTPENVAANPGLIRSANLLDCGTAVESILGRDCVDGRFNVANPATIDPFIGGPVFGLIPLPNGFEFGDGLNTGSLRFNAPVITREHLPSFRLDHRLSDRHQFYGTFNYIDREIEGDFINGRVPPYPGQKSLGDRITHSRGFSATLSSQLGPNFVNELRAGGLVHGENAFLINQPFDTPFALDLNTIRNPYSPRGGDSARDSDTYHVRNTFSWAKGKHLIQAGVEWRHRWVHGYSFGGVHPSIGLDDNDFPPGFGENDLRVLSGGTTDSFDHETAADLMNNLVGAVSEVAIRYNVNNLTSGFVPAAPERRKYQNRELDAFVNDTWTLRPNLTLNLGLRWEYSTVPYETQRLALVAEDGFDSVFGPSGRQGFFNPGVFGGPSCDGLTSLPTDATTENAIELITSCATRFIPGTSSNGRPLWNDDLNNFGPVVGFAWDPWGDGKTSIRAGFRVSYIQDHFNIIDGNLDDNEGLRVNQTCIPADGGCLNNPLFLRDVASTGLPVALPPEFSLPSSRSILDSPANDFRTYANNLATPYYEEWSFSVQREIMPNLALDIRYVGNRGVKLRRLADFNEINIRAQDPVTGGTFMDSFTTAQRNLDCNRVSGFGSRFDDTTGAPCVTANPLMTALIAGDAGRLSGRTALINALDFNEPGQFVHRLTQNDTSSPGPGQGRIAGGSWWGAVLNGRFPVNFFQANPFVASARAMLNDGFSTYHALEVELRQRFSNGFALQANYTFGKALSNYDGDQVNLNNNTHPSSVRNPGYTAGLFTPLHQFNANWLYELPFGAGKRFSSQNGTLRNLIGGWQLGGIVRWRSGRPFSIISGIGTFHRTGVSASNTATLAQPLSHGEIRSLTGRRTINGKPFWFDPCLSALVGGNCSDPRSVSGLFKLPDAGRLGELGQSIMFGPRQFLFDFNLSKRTRLTETLDLEFRWEVFNAFNNVNFELPTRHIFSTNFGQLARTATNPRIMQFALKVNF